MGGRKHPKAVADHWAYSQIAEVFQLARQHYSRDKIATELDLDRQRVDEILDDVLGFQRRLGIEPKAPARTHPIPSRAKLEAEKARLRAEGLRAKLNETSDHYDYGATPYERQVFHRYRRRCGY